MKHKVIFSFLVLASLMLCPSYLTAQGGTLPPPPCCNEPSAPPPPTIAGTLPGTDSSSTMSEITISDAGLSSAGLTRSEFLERIAAALLADTTTDLFIPFVIRTTDSASVATAISADGIVESAPVLYLQINRSQVTPEIMDTLDLLYLSDGKVCIKVIFIGDASASNR